jgi:hypothetical protein
MNIGRILLVSAALSACLVCSSAMAQGFGAGAGNAPYYSRPTVSPYLNLAVPNQFGISSYQTLVRPMLEQQAQASAQRQPSIKNVPLNRTAESPATARPTGIRTAARSDRYMNYSHFYGGAATR